VFQSQPRQKLYETPSQPIAAHGARLSSQATWETGIRKITVPGQHGQKSLKDPISTEKYYVWWYSPPLPRQKENPKITRAKTLVEWLKWYSAYLASGTT
jgi:hypothetical protein